MAESATTRQVSLRKRPDLEVHPHQYAHERFWVVKDPVALNYFHLRDEEHAILQMLDGRTSLQQIKERFEDAFAPLQLSFGQLQAFLGRLYRTGLVVADVPGQGEPLWERRQRRTRRGYWQAATSLLAMRFPGIDPEPLLTRLYPRVRWLFTWWFLAACGLLAAGAGLLVAVRFDELVARLPEFRAFFTAQNLVLLALSLALIKVLHEMGHALACKHFGGECHELGLMLLVFTPCLYCNVSDAWMLAGKWKRIAISSAGVIVEVVLAAVCTYVWWLTEPGLLNALCLNIMFICSVSTLLFNGNPLLRYDGYYVLADLAEVPNLSQQSRSLVTHYLATWLLGMPPSNDRALPLRGRWALVLYGVAAMIYRVFVVVLILWFVHGLLKPHGLAAIAQMLAVIVLTGLVAMPIWNLVRIFSDPNWRRNMKMKRVGLSGAAVVAVLVVICLVPLPHRVVAPAVIQPENARRVYVSVPGKLVESVTAGQQVEAGRQVVRLENPGLSQQVEQLRGQRDRQRLKVQNLELRLAADANAEQDIPTARETLKDIEKRLAERQNDERQLQLRAPVSGMVLPPPRRADPYYRDNVMPAWSGSPLDERNRGCSLDVGQLVCLIGDPERMEAVLVVTQTHVKDVHPGQAVRLRLDQLPGRVIRGRIDEVSQTPLEQAPPELALTGRLAVHFDQEDLPRPTDRCYEVRATLEEVPPGLLTGTSGHAKILAQPQTIARRLARFVKRTFHFDL